LEPGLVPMSPNAVAWLEEVVFFDDFRAEG
jgi:hypothetical protein